MASKGGSSSRYRPALALLLLLVLLWGVGHWLFGTLRPQFQEVFGLKGWRGAITQSLYDFGYIFLPIPAAIYARQFGSKAAILLSLGFLTIGTFTLYPAAEMHAFWYYVAASSFMLMGWITLENATNPLLVAMGPPQTAVSRLNLAQSLYPIGALAGICVGQWVQTSHLFEPHAGDSIAIAHPYIVVGGVVLLLAFALEETPFPAAASDRAANLSGIGSEIKQLLGRPSFRIALTAQCCCVLILGLMWMLMIPAYITLVGSSPSGWGNSILVCSILFAVGRVMGTAASFRIRPEKLLLLQSVLFASLALAAVFAGPGLRAILVLSLNLPFASVWPTIVALALRDLGPEMKLASGLLSTAGAIGGLITELMLLPPGPMPPGLMLVIAGIAALAIARYALSLERSRSSLAWQSPTP